MREIQKELTYVQDGSLPVLGGKLTRKYTSWIVYHSLSIIHFEALIVTTANIFFSNGQT